MGRHTCKLCFRRFSSGRALRGHMRSHVTSRLTRVPSLPPFPSASSSSSAADAAAGLGENPRKSFRLVDPELSSSFAGGGGGGGGGSSSIVQDRESETDSSLPGPLRCLSKRPRRPPETSTAAEAQPLSSISDVSSKEDVARCLMLLSRDAWDRSIAGVEAEDQQSGACDEAGAEDEDGEDGADGISGSACSRAFSSPQALGGHKRSHLASSSAASVAHSPPLPPPPLSANSTNTNLSGKGFIDLNQPAPLEEEVELSALSDATLLQSK